MAEVAPLWERRVLYSATRWLSLYTTWFETQRISLYALFYLRKYRRHRLRVSVDCLCLIYLPSGDKGGYIPYRDSKLTRLLQPSLGGNAQITIICTATPALLSCDETHNTLKFANRAKAMKNHAAINEVNNEKVRCLLSPLVLRWTCAYTRA